MQQAHDAPPPAAGRGSLSAQLQVEADRAPRSGASRAASPPARQQRLGIAREDLAPWLGGGAARRAAAMTASSPSRAGSSRTPRPRAAPATDASGRPRRRRRAGATRSRRPDRRRFAVDRPLAEPHRPGRSGRCARRFAAASRRASRCRRDARSRSRHPPRGEAVRQQPVLVRRRRRRAAARRSSREAPAGLIGTDCPHYPAVLDQQLRDHRRRR